MINSIASRGTVIKLWTWGTYKQIAYWRGLPTFGGQEGTTQGRESCACSRHDMSNALWWAGRACSRADTQGRRRRRQRGWDWRGSPSHEKCFAPDYALFWWLHAKVWVLRQSATKLKPTDGDTFFLAAFCVCTGKAGQGLGRLSYHCGY